MLQLFSVLTDLMTLQTRLLQSIDPCGGNRVLLEDALGDRRRVCFDCCENFEARSYPT